MIIIKINYKFTIWWNIAIFSIIFQLFFQYMVPGNLIHFLLPPKAFQKYPLRVEQSVIWNLVLYHLAPGYPYEVTGIILETTNCS